MEEEALNRFIDFLLENIRKLTRRLKLEISVDNNIIEVSYIDTRDENESSFRIRNSTLMGIVESQNMIIVRKTSVKIKKDGISHYLPIYSYYTSENLNGKVKELNLIVDAAFEKSKLKLVDIKQKLNKDKKVYNLLFDWIKDHCDAAAASQLRTELYSIMTLSKI